MKQSTIIIIVIVVLAICCLAVAVPSLIFGPAVLERLTSLANPTQAPASEPLSTDASMAEIQAQVSQLRGLSLTQDLPRQLLSPEELSRRVEEEFFAEYTLEDAAKDAKTLHLLGLLPAEFDLLNFYKQLYSEQVAGYYDNEIQTMYVVQSEGFKGPQRSTYAHEFTHALQDENFDFEGKLGYNDDNCEANSEYCAAIQSLIEGDATLTEANWIQQHATEQDINELRAFYAELDNPVLDSAPLYLSADMIFPYEKGYDFVNALYIKGGYPAINEAFTTNRPVSTEQILHPAKYPHDLPQPVPTPAFTDMLAAGWEIDYTDTIGEWFTYLILSSGDDPLTRQQDTLAKAAAEGWGGDAYALLNHPETDEQAIFIHYVWDTSTDASEAWKTFEKYAQTRFPNVADQGIMHSATVYSLLQADPAGIEHGFYWLLADTQAALQALMAALP